MDDILGNDRCVVNFKGYVSEGFSLDAGTAQGRRQSVDMFNCLMRRLHDLVVANSVGVSAWTNEWPGQVLQIANQLCPATGSYYDVALIRQCAKQWVVLQ
eukprot:9361435-Karenia_brevis.AAC.1